jgi:cholest-5-ene-3beta,7alpha-diol 3beta-dehydrogenase
MNNRPHILLTGAAGAVGLELLKQLYAEREKLELTVFELKSLRNRKKLSKFKRGIDIVYGDITNFSDIGKACRDKDFVIHLCAIIPPLADKDPELAYKVNVTGTENLIKNLELHSPGSFLLYSSSISVYGDRQKDPIISEGDPLLPSEGDEYAKTKIRAEQLIRNSRLDWSIFRLTAIMGKHKVSELMFHMPLSTKLEIGTPEDTGRAFIRALDNRDRISKKIFNLGGGEACRTSYKDFLVRSFAILGLGKLSFPDKAFADKNFHCGFYGDGDELENILHFRKAGLESYYSKLENSTNSMNRLLTVLLRGVIKRILLKQSGPYRAFIKNDKIMKAHFFNE